MINAPDLSGYLRYHQTILYKCGQYLWKTICINTRLAPFSQVLPDYLIPMSLENTQTLEMRPISMEYYLY